MVCLGVLSLSQQQVKGLAVFVEETTTFPCAVLCCGIILVYKGQL